MFSSYLLLLLAVVAFGQVVAPPPPPVQPCPPPPSCPTILGSGDNTEATKPETRPSHHTPGPEPGQSCPTHPPCNESGDNNTGIDDKPKPPGPPPPPPHHEGSGNDSTRPRPPPPGEHTPQPGEHTPPHHEGSGNDSTRPPPPPPGEHTPPPPPHHEGSGNDSTKPPPPSPGEHTPPHHEGSGNDSTRPRPPSPGEHTNGPGGDETPRPPPTPGRPHPVIETSVNQNYSLHMYGGDIALTPEQQATLEATSNQISPFSIQNAVVRSEQFLWKDGIVYYILDDTLYDDATNAIQDAMDAYMEQTCITFEERTNQQDYVRFYRGNGCYSYIGRVTGPQDISIGRGCEHMGIVMHEIFHALGRWHEQSRPDRDLFIKINDENIAPGVESNFEVVSTAFATTQGIQYDFRSLMHYDAYSFTSNGQPTIEPLDSANIPLDSLGQREGLSSGDLLHINTLYCEGYAGGTWSGWGSWSKCSQSCNGGSRTRTRVCEGGGDCEGSNIDIEQCNTNICTVEAEWSDWTVWSDCTVSCGGGRRTRRRKCEGGNTCIGRQTEYTDCNTNTCPEGSSWAEWGSWSDCSQTCQGGTTLRRRQCQNGNDCTGSNVEVQYCNSNIPCDGSVTGSEWTDWSECTEPCGNGTEFRTRGCSQGSSVCESENQPCNTQDCNPEPNLKGIEHVGCYWVPPIYSSNLVFLEGTTEDLNDNPWEREDPIAKCGTAAQLYNFNVFALAVGFCISGSSDLRHYQSFETDFCESGVGGYHSRWMAMDVYMISDVQSFLDSASTMIPEKPSDVGVEGTGGQAMLTALPSSVFLVLLVGALTV